VEVEWRSYQLDPRYPKGERQPAFEGDVYDFEHSVMVNTFDAHRVTHLAKAQGLGGEMHERLMRAQLIEGETLNDIDTLVRLAAEVGVDDSAALRVLTSDAYASEVSDDIRDARALGVTGVPFFVLDKRYGISGAQPVEAFRAALKTASDGAQATC
jgi:predicted DsbA family dithiol-disulfide isomerase